MNQTERRIFLIRSLLRERRDAEFPIPQSANEQRQLLRSLMNIRPPKPISAEFLKIQDEYLHERTQSGITRTEDLTPVCDEMYIWQGDITTLKCTAIVNAANSGMTGCYVPCHKCIDNCIHTYAGIQLRLECDSLMRNQGYEEPIGRAKVTKAYNLPCEYVLHTVGPAIQEEVTPNDEAALESCYRACMEAADAYRMESIAFCCISTGVFRFPNELAAQIAVQAVRDYKAETGSSVKVIFNVFKERDKCIYERLLCAN